MNSLWRAANPWASSTDTLVPGQHFDTVVTGAGITGLTTAALLARSGQRVCVIEAREVGALTTGASTGKVSLLQGSMLSEIRRFQSEEVLRAYVQANLEGQAWLLRFLRETNVEAQLRTAFTYSTEPAGVDRLHAELAAARLCGLDVRWVDDAGLPFRVRGALALSDQAQVDPMQVLGALVREVRDHGGQIVEGISVVGARSGPPVRIDTSTGQVSAENLVLATGFPVLDRGGYFARLLPLRSYLLSFDVASSDLPQGMYLSIDDPGRSMRTAPDAAGERLLVGGNGHVVGRGGSTLKRVNDLRRWTERHFPGASCTHAWSAQDYRALGRVPFVGALPRGGGHIWLATGFNKWGLTNGVAAALNLTGRILGGHMEWAQTLGARVTRPAVVAEALATGAGVGANLVGGWAEAVLRPKGHQRYGMEGAVVREGTKLVAESSVDDRRCRVSGVCTHLGGVLRFNDAENTWDCPLHGSRFAADGAVLEGPATKPLAPRDGPVH